MPDGSLILEKYEAAGNDFLIVGDGDFLAGLLSDFALANQGWVEKICHRRFGIGADGFIVVKRLGQSQVEMVYFNSDGNRSSLCGNGLRATALFCTDHLGMEETVEILAADGWHKVELLPDRRLSAEMCDVHAPIPFEGDWIIDTGSPHYVRFVTEVGGLDIKREGASIRYAHPFVEEGINVNFIQILGENHIRIRTYERGVEDETLSCGTGVTAAAVAYAHQRGLAGNQQIEVIAEGGELAVEMNLKGDGMATAVRLIGPARHVFTASNVGAPQRGVAYF